MNEHAPRPESTPQPRPAADTGAPDWRRLDVARGRYTDRVAEGVAAALTEHRGIDHDTARMIAHVLGRSHGRGSHLAAFGRTGEGGYRDLRDEYLPLYADQHADASTKEWISWLGTYLVEREHLGSGHQFITEQIAPQLERLLVASGVGVNDSRFTVHVPASDNQATIDQLAETLRDLRLDEDEALQAYLSLADVNALSGDIMGGFDQDFVGSFRNIEDAIDNLCDVDELENDVNTYAAERGLFVEQYSVDYEALRNRLGDGYDVVEWNGRVHVFYR